MLSEIQKCNDCLCNANKNNLYCRLCGQKRIDWIINKMEFADPKPEIKIFCDDYMNQIQCTIQNKDMQHQHIDKYEALNFNKFFDLLTAENEY